MNEGAKRMLQEIVEKEVQMLTEYDIAILRARISYLSNQELEKFAEVLKEEVVVVALEDMKFAELKAVCAERGIEVPTTVKSKEAILALIAQATPVE